MIAAVLFYYAAWASPPSSVAAPSFAGTYATRVTLKRDDCGGVKVEDNPTTVTHDTATSIVTLRHAGTTYGGRVGADSTFRTQPKPVDVNDGFVYTIAISGKFKANAFEAEATVDKTAKSGGAKCRFVVGWVGTKS